MKGRPSEVWPADVLVPDSFGGFILATVMRVQMSEGPGQRWPAVRVMPEDGSYPAGVNWPIEDVARIET